MVGLEAQENNMTKLKSFILLFLIQLVLYLLLVINYIFISNLSYQGTIISDFVIASFNFFIIRKIAQSENSFYQWAGYAFGGAAGGALGLYVSQYLL